MPNDRSTAQRLLTASEFTLFEASRRDGLATLTAAQLKTKHDRARRLRDKYRDLFRRQRLAARARAGSKGGRSGTANARTEAKAALFEDILLRFHARLQRLAAREAPKPRRKPVPARKAAAPVAGPRTARSPKASSRGATASGGQVAEAGFMTSRARLTETRSQTARSRGKAIHAHLSGRNRRSQGKRDRR